MEPDPEPLRPKLALAFGVALMLATLVPSFAGWAWTPPGMQFLWVRTVNPEDTASNYARIERVRAGDVLIQNPYELGEHPGVPRPTYLLAGLTARLSGCSAPFAAHAWRVVFGVLFVLAFYRLAGLVFPAERERWLALVLGCLGSGFSWLGALTRRTGHLNLWPDAWQPEANTFASLLEAPHFALSLWLLVEAVLGLWRALDPACERWGRPLACGALSVCFLLFDHPFNAPTAAALVAIGLGLGWREGVPRRRLLAVAGGFLFAAMIPVGWLGALLAVDPVLAGHASKNLLPSPGPDAYLLAYGFLWAFALVGGRLLWTQRPRWAQLLIAWALLPWLLIYLPVSFQRRMVEGWQLPLALLAAARVGEIAQAWGRARAIVVVALCCVGTPALVAHELYWYRRPETGSYVQAERYAAWEWLRGRVGPQDAVLGAKDDSLWIPALVACRGLPGHWAMGGVPEGLVESLQASLAEAQASGAAPRPRGPSVGLRYLVAVRDASGRYVVNLPSRELEPTWAPAFQNAEVRIYELARSP